MSSGFNSSLTNFMSQLLDETEVEKIIQDNYHNEPQILDPIVFLIIFPKITF